MKKMIILSWCLAVILAGCSITAGSPPIKIIKNVYIIDSDHADVGYKTESSTNSVAEITQDLKDLLDLSLEPKIK